MHITLPLIFDRSDFCSYGTHKKINRKAQKYPELTLKYPG